MQQGDEDEPNILFMPSGLRGRVPPGTTILQAAQRLGVDLESICGGQGKCRKCQVRPQQGEFPKHGIVSSHDHLSPLTEVEQRQRQVNKMADDRRMGCQALIVGDLVVDVPEDSQQHRQHIAKAVTAFDIQVQPALRLFRVTLPEPDMHAPMSDKRRLQKALSETHDLPRLEVELSQIRLLQKPKIVQRRPFAFLGIACNHIGRMADQKHISDLGNPVARHPFDHMVGHVFLIEMRLVLGDRANQGLCHFFGICRMPG